MINQVLHGDCLEILKDIPDNSIDLICTDPPYFKVKKDWWDRQWKKTEGFLSWLDSVAEQWQRVLKPNGSLYCFASPKMAARVEVMLGERFAILSNIVWNKLFEYPDGDRRATAFRARDHSSFREYFDYSERIIFCEHYGADNAGVLGEFLKQKRESAGLTCDAIEKALGYTDNRGRGSRLFCRWETGNSLPTSDDFCKALQVIGDDLPYEKLRQQYEELRRPFSVTADVPYTDVWTFPTVSHYPGKHPCEKPAELLEHIIKASSRPGAVVLDSFAGSGSTLLASKKLGRNYVGIEIDPHWVDTANQRLGNFHNEPTLEERVQWLETQVKAQNNKIKKIENKQLSLFSDLA